MVRRLALALALLWPSFALAQGNFAPVGAALFGAGPGVQGFLTVGPCTTNQTITWTGSTPGCSNLPGTGTVLSVGLTLPASVFSVTGSPVTASGTLAGAFINQTANTVFAGPPSGVAAVPGFRLLTGADLPNPTTSALGGVQAIVAVAQTCIR